MAELDQTPTRRDNFRFEEMEGESLLFNEVTKRTIYLNESATVIWRLCDGTRTIRDIIGLLREAYSDAEEDFETDVRDTVDRLLNEGAVTCQASADVPPISPGS